VITSNPPGPFDPSWESLERYQTPEWYLDAKFGIFIHWGVYAVPAFANEWYPRQMYLQGDKCFDHHVATYGPHTEFGYKDFIPLFKAENFDPEAWAKLFRDSGAKYVVPVAEHHDGFAMYATKLSKWNSKEMGPMRDVTGDLAAAVRKEGLVFGCSSHRAEHWWFMNGGNTFPSDVQDPTFADFYGPAQPKETQPNEAYLDDWLARCCELVDLYRPQVFWFDWWIEEPAFASHLRRFAAYYYNRAYAWGQGVAINFKHEAMPTKAAVFDVERGQLDDIRPYFWQTDTAVGKKSWSHIEGEEYKSAESLIHDLVDIVSKNGCLLLNIGPKADGTIAVEDQAILREIGAWLAVNGEAVYGTRPWKVYGEGPTQVVAGQFKDTERAPFTCEDVRFTTKGTTLYATVLAWPTNGRVLIRSLGSGSKLLGGEIQTVSLVGSDAQVKWTRLPEGLELDLPTAGPAEHAFVIRIES
jgi:alpha-L-fucosidase